LKTKNVLVKSQEQVELFNLFLT